MKYLIKCLPIFVCILFFCNCSNPEAENEISRLNAEKKNIASEIEQVKKKLDSISAYSDSVQNKISDLDLDK